VRCWIFMAPCRRRAGRCWKMLDLVPCDWNLHNSTCTWPMMPNEDALDTFSTSLTSSCPRLQRKRYSSSRKWLVNTYTPHFPSLLRSTANYASEAVSTPPMGREPVEEVPEACTMLAGRMRCLCGCLAVRTLAGRQADRPDR